MSKEKDDLEVKLVLEECRGKKVLLLPRMLTPDLDNRDDPTSPMYKLIKVAEFLDCPYTFDVEDSYEAVIGRWSGEALFTEGTPEHNVFRSGKPFIELSWCSINRNFFLERVSRGGINTHKMNTDIRTYFFDVDYEDGKTNTTEPKDALEGVHVVGDPIEASSFVPIIWGDSIFMYVMDNLEMVKRGICEWEGVCEWGGMVKFPSETSCDIGDNTVSFTPVPATKKSDYVYIGERENFCFDGIDVVSIQKDVEEFSKTTENIAKVIITFFEKLEKSVGTFSKLAWSLSSISFNDEEGDRRITVIVDYGYQTEEKLQDAG